jgi:hypothetical protein
MERNDEAQRDDGQGGVRQPDGDPGTAEEIGSGESDGDGDGGERRPDQDDRRGGYGDSGGEAAGG